MSVALPILIVHFYINMKILIVHCIHITYKYYRYYNALCRPLYRVLTIFLVASH